jgi:hypothetical protein
LPKYSFYFRKSIEKGGEPSKIEKGRSGKVHRYDKKDKTNKIPSEIQLSISKIPKMYAVKNVRLERKDFFYFIK